MSLSLNPEEKSKCLASDNMKAPQILISGGFLQPQLKSLASRAAKKPPMSVTNIQSLPKEILYSEFSCSTEEKP